MKTDYDVMINRLHELVAVANEGGCLDGPYDAEIMYFLRIWFETARRFVPQLNHCVDETIEKVLADGREGAGWWQE
jgi:hypothetical protein